MEERRDHDKTETCNGIVSSRPRILMTQSERHTQIYPTFGYLIVSVISFVEGCLEYVAKSYQAWIEVVGTFQQLTILNNKHII